MSTPLCERSEVDADVRRLLQQRPGHGADHRTSGHDAEKTDGRAPCGDGSATDACAPHA